MPPPIKTNSKHQRNNTQSYRVRGGDEGAEGEALGHGHGVGGMALREAEEHQADEDGGDEGAHHGVQHLLGWFCWWCMCVCGGGVVGIGGWVKGRVVYASGTTGVKHGPKGFVSQQMIERAGMQRDATHDGHEVVEEDLAPERVARVEDDGREEAFIMCMFDVCICQGQHLATRDARWASRRGTLSYRGTHR